MLRLPDSAPSNIHTLLERADALSGQTLGELAQLASIKMPANLRRHKGWPGQLIELWLGAAAGSKPEQDFPELGVELKTLPIDHNGAPLETTYVCYAPLMNTAGLHWHNSNVRNKLQQVLWVPMEASRTIPVAERRIATPFLWSLSNEQELALQRDWEEIMHEITLGRVESVTARLGQVMQLRPKAANGKALTDAIGEQGQRIQTRPRGFYLKKAFTRRLLEEVFGES